MRKLLLILVVVAMGLSVFGLTAAAAPDRPLMPECMDGQDNDGDGLVDHPDDPGCRTPAGIHEEDRPRGDEPPCREPRDDRPRESVDAAVDAAAAARPDRPRGDEPDRPRECPDDPGPRPPQCADGRDNDGDGLIDHPDDPGCESPDDDSEGERPGEEPNTCTDGEDNDGDGATDADDTECQDPEDGVEDGSDVVDTCTDGEDNDGDGATDADDTECQDPEDGVEDGSDVVAGSCGDPDGDGVDHSAFAPDADESGPLSSVVHEVDQSLPSPVGGDQGVVTEVNCAIVASVLGL